MTEIPDAHEEASHPASLAAKLSAQHVADIVEFMNEQELDTASGILVHLPFDRAVEVLDYPRLDAAAELIQDVPIELALALLQAMSADRAAALFRRLEDPARSRLLARLDPATESSLQRLLAYPPGSAGSLMTTEFVGVPATWTVERTLDHVREVEHSRETVYAIYILDPSNESLLRVVSLRRLIMGESGASILSIAPDRRPVMVPPSMDQEDVARLIAKYDLLAVPVTAGTGHVLGIVTVDDIIDAMTSESTEDVQKFGGMEAIDQPYWNIGYFQMIRKRGGWLAVLFMGEMLTASAMQHYEADLAKAIVLALFIPLIMSSGGNSGAQATSLLVRALALQEVRVADWWRVALRELPAGITLGALLGAIGMSRIALWQVAGLYDYGEHWELVALTIGAALVSVVTFGSLVGSMLPLVMHLVNIDPAAASAPFVATLVDVTGIVIYLSIALLILSGTVL
jgi:magnesium transporter